MVRSIYYADGVANGGPLRWPIASRPVIGEQPDFVFERIRCEDFGVGVSIEICHDQRIDIRPTPIRLRNGKIPFTIAQENRNQITGLGSCLRVVEEWEECCPADYIQMPVPIHIRNHNRRVEIAHHRRGVWILGKIAVACTIGHREKTQASELYGIETSVLIHVTDTDDHRTIVEAQVAARRETLPGLAEIGHEVALSVERDHKINVAIVVQVARSDPGRW